MKNNLKIWYSFQGGESEDCNVGFYDKKDFYWAELLESNYQLIQKEVSEFLEKNKDVIKPYFNQQLVEKKNKWLASGFLFWGWKVKKNLRQCPQTAKIIRKIPNLVSASISILEPGAEIKPHRGDTNAIVRAHLGLEVKHGLPNCGFRVVNTEISWKEGEVVIFNDAAWHKAWNKTSDRRIILLIDVVRHEFINKKFSICSTVLTSFVMQSLFQKIPFFKYLPKFGKATLFLLIYSGFNILLRIKESI